MKNIHDQSHEKVWTHLVQFPFFFFKSLVLAILLIKNEDIKYRMM